MKLIWAELFASEVGRKKNCLAYSKHYLTQSSESVITGSPPCYIELRDRYRVVCLTVFGHVVDESI